MDVEAGTRHLNRLGLLCGHDCEFTYDSLTQKEREKTILHLEEDFIEVGENEKKKGLHPGVIFGLKSILGTKACILRTSEFSGNGVWFVPSSEKEKTKLQARFSSLIKKLRIINFT